MADDILGGITTSADQIRANHEAYKDKYVESGTNGINSETFLKLLVAEMSNQDPLQPTSNTEFISQLAQFSAMGYMQEAGKYAKANHATSLVGKTVTASKVDGKDVVMVTGVVTKATPTKDGSSYTLTIDGEDFDLSKITAVVDPNTSTDLVGSSILADRIAQAASLVTMYAAVKTGEDEEGNDIVDEGFITSVQVKDGKIRVTIGEKDYDVADILEVTYATVVDPDQKPGDGDNTGDTGDTGDNGDKGDTGDVGGVGGGDNTGDTTDKVDGGENGGNSDKVEQSLNYANAASLADLAAMALGAEDIPDVADVTEDEVDMARQLQEIINSMS